MLPLSGHGQPLLHGAVKRCKQETIRWALRPVKPTAPTLQDDLAQWQPQGALVEAGATEAEEWCRKQDIPFVSVLASAMGGAQAQATVSLDDPAIGRMAAKYFSDRGYRHFGFAGNGIYSFSLDRQAGYSGWLRSHGHTTHEFVHSTPEHDRQLHPRVIYHNELTAWLLKLPRPLALFAANDWEALAVAQACGSANISIPDEIALLGAGDDPLACQLCTPPISSIKLPFAQVGSEAMGQLLVAMRGKRGRRVPGPKPLSPLTIITRESSAGYGVTNTVVRNALDYMSAHLEKPFRVAALLAKLDVSRSSLERHFKSEFGTTPLVVLRNLRIERATQLLADTTLNNAQIAALSGFASNIRFVTVFRQLTRTTPAVYRERLKFESQL